MTGFLVWFTGLPGAGKTTLSQLLAGELTQQFMRTEVLDGDVIRDRLSKGLGFGRRDRDENIRRIAFVAELLTRHDIHVIVAAVSPYRAVRNEVRSAHPGRFIEVFVDCPKDVLIARDPKGLYRKALAGEIQQFTGVSDPYEPPLNPEIHVHTDEQSPAATVQSIVEWLSRNGFLNGVAAALDGRS
jgi:adenylylsulfate kinase